MDKEQHILFEITQLLSYLATLDELRAERQRPIFGAKWEAWKHKMLQIFHFLQSDAIFRIVNPAFRECLMPSPVRKVV